MPSLILFVDRSASTTHYIARYLDAVNNIIFNQSPDTLLTVITFNHRADVLCLNKPVHSIERPLSAEDVVPEGGTAIYDVLASQLVRLMQFQEKTTMEPAVVVVLTDGEDNASVRCSTRLVYVQISRLREQGWKFIFLNPTENCIQIGHQMGANVSIVYDEKTMDRVADVVNDVMRQGVPVDGDIDIRQLSASMAGLGVN